VLAAPVLADRDQPAFDRSMMDGFALRSADASTAGSTLDVVGVVAAGDVPTKAIGSGEALRIMTGAMVPPGADAVEMFENTQMDDTRVTLSQPVSRGKHIAPRGEELRAGAVAVAERAVLTAARRGLCWSVGAAEVSVIRRPTVAILATGDELVDLRTVPKQTQIRDSNRCSVGDVLARAGAIIQKSRLVPDDRLATRTAISEALRVADMLVLSGGVSAGDYDYVGDCLIDEGVRKVFHKVCMKPGKPLWYGRFGLKPVFGLPGNPVSSFVTARIFAAPVVRALCGRRDARSPVVSMPLLTGFGATRGRPVFQPGIVRWGKGVELVSTRGSGDLRHFSAMNALVFLEANRPGFSVGDAVQVYLDEEALWGE
jgi:molybdopterin molybdotransferase